jgi:hypothetical protein
MKTVFFDGVMKLLLVFLQTEAEEHNQYERKVEDYRLLKYDTG